LRHRAGPSSPTSSCREAAFADMDGPSFFRLRAAQHPFDGLPITKVGEGVSPKQYFLILSFPAGRFLTYHTDALVPQARSLSDGIVLAPSSLFVLPLVQCQEDFCSLPLDLAS